MTRETANSLPPNQQLAAKGKWPVVGERKPRASEAPWTLTIDGLVGIPKRWSLEEIFSLPQSEIEVDIHCVTRWSMLGAKFTGIPLKNLLDACSPSDEARFLSFVARSERNHSTSLPLQEAIDLKSFLATAYEGRPIESIHGGPIRMIVPGKYFYKSVKWLERIEVLAEDRLGYWEADTGYHNGADPWREERYMAPNLDRHAIQRLLISKEFAGLDLRSIDASHRDLNNLLAENSLLRDANFQHCNLRKANFCNANLSNAHLEFADLREANLQNGDLEGADFRSADLRGADFRSASLFGATFCCEPDQPGGNFGPAILDSTTLMEPTALEALTPHQFAFVHHAVFGSI